MKELKINPTKARVKGNILANWDDVLSKTSFEDYHVSREKISNITWNNNSLSALRLNAKAEPVKVGLVPDVTSIFPNGEISTITISVKYTKNNTRVALPNHTVYLYDDDVLIATMVTNADGECTYEYSSNVEGTHTITARTPHMNGFEAGSSSIKMNVIINLDIVLEPRTLYAGYGEIHQLRATMKTINEGIPVADKPITFYEGSRVLATVNTDENGVAMCNYSESESQGALTTITADTVPARFDKGTQSTITGHITTSTGEIPTGNIRLYTGKDMFPYPVASAPIQQDGTFTFKYMPVNNVLETYKYYLVYPSTLSYDSVNIVQTQGYFDLNQWIGTGTGGARYIDGATALVCEQQNNYLKDYGNGNTYMNGDEWSYKLDVEIDIKENGTPNAQIGDANGTEGNTVIHYINGEWKFKAWDSTGALIINDYIQDFVNAEHPRNTVTFTRKNSIMTVKYKSVTNNQTVTLTRSYNQSVPDNSRLVLRTEVESSSWIIRTLEITRNNPKIIHESVNEFNLSEWGGTGLTNRTITNGILNLSNEYNHFKIYPDGGNFIQGYKWRITLDIELNGNDSVNLQQIYDQNWFEGNTAVRRENNVWKFLAWDENNVNVANQIIADIVNETYPRNKLIITRDGSSIMFQYKNKATNELVTLRRSYNSSIAMDSRLVIMASANAYWKLYDLKIEQYTKKDNYADFEPTWTDIGEIPMYIDGTLIKSKNNTDLG